MGGACENRLQTFSDLFDKMQAGILAVDNKKNIIYANTKLLQTLKLSEKEIHKTTCGQLLHPENPECHECHTQLYKNHILNLEGKSKNILVTSSKIQENLTVKIVQDISKILISLNDLSTDIDELKRIIKGTFGNKSIRIVCCECHNLKMPDGSWASAENIDRLKASRVLSLGLCPACALKSLETLKDFRDFINTRRCNK